MNPKQFAAIALVAFSFTASMPIALAQDEHAQHEDDHPETSPGLVRDVRHTTQRLQDANAATAAGYVSVENCESGQNEGSMGVHYVNDAYYLRRGSRRAATRGAGPTESASVVRAVYGLARAVTPPRLK
jgi:hypothetical protein